MKSKIILITILVLTTISTHVGKTRGGYKTDLHTEENTLTAGVLDFSLVDSESNDIGDSIFNGDIITPNDSTKSGFYVEKEEGMDFEYEIQIEDISGDEDFCDVLNVKLKVENTLVYDGDFTDMDDHRIDLSGDKDEIDLEVYLPESDSEDMKHKTCEFDITVVGKPDLDDSGGFSDEERIEDNSIVSGDWEEIKDPVPMTLIVPTGFSLMSVEEPVGGDIEGTGTEQTESTETDTCIENCEQNTENTEGTGDTEDPEDTETTETTEKETVGEESTGETPEV